MSEESAARKARARKNKHRIDRFLERVNVNAAGIDVGASKHWVAVPPDRSSAPVQPFGVNTVELQRLVSWLQACGIDTVAMESTGVYWIPLYEILEAAGFKVVLANARHVKSVPGRKSDVLDCQWIQQLHTFGLLAGSFRPSGDIVALRSLVRHREKLVQEAASFVLRMQKALVLMNLQLPAVLSDIKGKTGIAILRDIVAGQTDPRVLARHRDIRCKASEQDLIDALTGHYRPEQIFVLRQNIETFDYLQSKIVECDAEIEHHLGDLQAGSEPPDDPLPRRRQRRPSVNEPDLDLRSPLYRMCGGIDLTQVPGIGPLNALSLIAEIGTDMSRWPSAQHFASWLALAPNNRESGARRISSKTRTAPNRAAKVFRMAALNNSRSDNAIAAHYRRLAFRIGTPKAVTATARKLAIIVYTMLKDGQPYVEMGAAVYSARPAKARVKRLSQSARELGYRLTPLPTVALAEPQVS